ncbi:hypothetical protein [Bacillus solitudinis]|uniref:hypothetical protein n=1 Tax=Bacillus solitudinis TaxID=2014074 RepID=UPI000C241A19|nr:hypothetical protein [Bacillus solitudinis]
MKLIEQHICDLELDEEGFENRSLAEIIRDMISGFETKSNIVLLDQLHHWKNNNYVIVLNEYEKS